MSPLRLAARGLRRSPLFAAVATLILGFGIGGIVVSWSVVDAFLLAPLPYPDADRLVHLYRSDPATGADQLRFSQPMVDELAAVGPPIEALGAYTYVGRNLSGDDADPAHVTVAALTPELFALLRPRLALGRGLLSADAEPASPPIALLGWDLWQSRFGGREDAVGSSLRLDGEPHRVVGVLPRGFAFPYGEVEVWTPLRPDHRAAAWSYENFQPVARLSPGATSEQARAVLDARYRAVETERHGAAPEASVRVVPLRSALLFLHDLLRIVFLLVLAANGFVLLIVCANLAGLLLARAAARIRDTAIRTALGAGRLEIATHFLAEGALLALAGGGLGLLLASWGARAMDRLLPEALYRSQPVAVNDRAVAVALAVALGTILLLALAPALAASRVDLVTALRAGTPQGGHSGRFQRLQRHLVRGQGLAAFVLLLATLLMVRTVLSMGGQDLGFEPARVLTAGIHLPQSRYPDAAAVAALESRLVEGIVALPGVRAVALVDPLPLNFAGHSQRFEIEGREPQRADERWSEPVHRVGPRYFATMGVPLLRGRDFAPADDLDAPAVAVVSRLFAERYWPSEEAVGRRLRLAGNGSEPEWATVIGVVGDAKSLFAHEPPHPTLYLPLRQQPRRAAFLVASTLGPPEQALGSVAATVRSLDPDLPLAEPRPMAMVVEASMLPWRGTAAGLVVLAGLGLLLAVLGLYGVLAHQVATRTPEIGLRRALGASGTAVAGLVLRQAVALVGAGVAAGAAVSLVVGRLIQQALVGVAALDVTSYLLVTALLGATGLAAAAAPLLRALRVDPARALRFE